MEAKKIATKKYNRGRDLVEYLFKKEKNKKKVHILGLSKKSFANIISYVIVRKLPNKGI